MSSTRRSSFPTSACGRSRGDWLDEPFIYDGNRVAYEPAESASPIYGGNSNWRGPIWFPVNYLMIEALREFHRYYGSSIDRRAAPLARTRRRRSTRPPPRSPAA